MAVIFRRGPTRFTRLLRWDLRDDTVRAGQWLIGRVAPAPCGLSPDGELLIYEARKGAQTFTAISRPPYFTALAFWEYASPWTGGGFFSANETVVLGLTFEDPKSAGSFPPGFEVTDVWSYFATSGRPSVPIYEAARKAPEANHGWCTTALGTVQKPNPVRLPPAPGADPDGTRQAIGPRGRAERRTWRDGENLRARHARLGGLEP